MYRSIRTIVLLFLFSMLVSVQVQAQPPHKPLRPVLVPFVVTGNGGVDPAYSLRLSHLVAKSLHSMGWEVVRPFSPDMKRPQWQRMLERYENRPVQFARRLLRQYWADLVYVVRADVTVEPQKTGSYRATVRVVGQGYTRRGGDVATVARRFTVTDATEAGAVEAALLRIRHGITKRVARWRAGFPVVAETKLRQLADRHGDLLRIYLQGAPDDDLIELFDGVIATTPGVKHVRRIRSRLDPRQPGRSVAVWEVETTGIDPFFIESNIMDTLKDEYAVERIIASRDQEASVDRDVMGYLRWIRPGDASTDKLCFIVDWCAAGDARCVSQQGFTGRCAARRWHHGPDQGFE